MTENDALNDIAGDLENVLEFRREKACQYPGDERNDEAVRIIEKLYEQVEHLSGTPAIRAYAEAIELASESSFDRSEELNRFKQRIGFDHFPSDIFSYVSSMMNIIDPAGESFKRRPPYRRNLEF